MHCHRCEASNPETQKYCGECGAPLDQTSKQRDLVRSIIRDEVAKAAAEQLKNQKIIETELTEGVTKRLLDWAKFYVGIPGAILLLALGLFGIERLSDLRKLVDAAKPDIDSQLQGAKDVAKQVKTQTDALQTEDKALMATYARLSSDADKYAALSTKLEELTRNTQSLQKTVSLLPAIEVHVFDGHRDPISPQLKLLVTLINGTNEQVSRDYHAGPSLTFGHLPFYDNFRDNYSVVVGAEGYRQIGYFPVRVSTKALGIVDLMLIPKDAKFNFRSADWDLMKRNDPRLERILAAGAPNESVARQRYEKLIADKPQAAASLFNVTTAMAQVYFQQGAAVDYIKGLVWDDSLATDRLFGYVDRKLIIQLRASQQGQFKFVQEAGAGLFHAGATSTYKQVQFGEANLQLTFYENDASTIGGVECVKMEMDMDYYKDLAGHVMLEVVSASAASRLEDPRTVYVLRWMAGRRAGMPEFNPPYTIE